MFERKRLMHGLKSVVCKRSPELLMSIGMVGMIATTILAVKATPKALELIDKAREDNGGEELTAVETIKTAWKPYIPAAVTCVFSIAALVGSTSINHRRNAVLITAYQLSESALKEYRGKVKEVIGEKKEREIQDEIAKDKVTKKPVENKEVIITKAGDSLCFDAISGRYFKSDIEKIRKVINDLNANLISDMYISLNEYYYEVGLDPTNMGEDIGWNINEGLIEPNFSSQLATNGEPCLVIGFSVAPRFDYTKLM